MEKEFIETISKSMTASIQYIDSHTEGEPTRVVLAGGPELGNGTLAKRRSLLEQQFDDFRTSVILEPRGTDALVGALLCEPVDSSCVAGVIFFDNKVYLGMCGHGMIGLLVTLAHMGRIKPGQHRIETPVGMIEAELLNPNEVVVQNVPSYRYLENLSLHVPELGTVTGDIAWGGNWFFLMKGAPHPLEPRNIQVLSNAAEAIKQALIQGDITGEDGSEVDHIIFYGAPALKGADSKNFVYCPGGAYDRSPCGTATSAKLACLAAEGQLKPGEEWVQESIIGSSFRASYQPGKAGAVIPTLRGRAFVCAEGKLHRNAQDPYRDGIQL